MAPFPTRLMAGYATFREGRLATERERYARLAEAGQRPEVMVIGCCDSRVSPEAIFDCGPGEMFVLRNVANLVPPYTPDSQYHGTSAAIEFGVLGLGVRDIVVLGHGRCGGIKALVAGVSDLGGGGDFIGRWMSILEPERADTPKDGDAQQALEFAAIARSLDNLTTFPFIRDRLALGLVRLYGAWFDIATGTLRVLDGDTGEFADVDANAA